MIPQTKFQKHLAAVVAERYSAIPPKELLEILFEMGVVDHTRCKVLAVREYVDKLMSGGEKKVNSMWIAAEHFACSYEYIRKCMYYYTDVNVI